MRWDAPSPTPMRSMRPGCGPVSCGVLRLMRRTYILPLSCGFPRDLSARQDLSSSPAGCGPRARARAKSGVRWFVPNRLARRVPTHSVLAVHPPGAWLAAVAAVAAASAAPGSPGSPVARWPGCGSLPCSLARSLDACIACMVYRVVSVCLSSCPRPRPVTCVIPHLSRSLAPWAALRSGAACGPE